MGSLLIVSAVLLIGSIPLGALGVAQEDATLLWFAAFFAFVGAVTAFAGVITTHVGSC